MKRLQNIKIKDLSWKPEKEVEPVLQNINIELETGHIYGIIGPNGAGKTSLLRHILGNLRSDGNIELSEKPLQEFSARELAREISFVPQRTEAVGDLSAEDIVMMGRNPYIKRFAGEDRQDAEAVNKALKATGMSGLAERNFATLSAGEAQKIIVARAIAQDTVWMLLDEPSANLDVKNQLEIMDNLKRLQLEKGLSIIAVLHDINLALAYCDRIIMMKGGSVVHMGSTEECFTEEKLGELYEVDFMSLTILDGRKIFFPRPRW